MFELSNIGIFTAFLAGVVSFLSPCVLPLVPGYISYVSGNAIGHAGSKVGTRALAIQRSLCFVLGFSTIFIALGASATAVSQLLLAHRYEASLIGGAVIIVFGVFMIGIIPMQWLERDMRFHGPVKSGRPFGAYVLGIAFGFGWTPCIGPVLGAILTVSALSSTVSSGIALLTIYSLGLGLPFLLSAIFTERLMRHRKGLGGAGRFFKVGAGAVMIAMGIATITGYMTVFSYWLLENVPMLARIG